MVVHDPVDCLQCMEIPTYCITPLEIPGLIQASDKYRCKVHRKSAITSGAKRINKEQIKCGEIGLV